MTAKRQYNRRPLINAAGKLRVKELLKERGMTITQLAEKIGANREVISRALIGNPTYSLLADIASALNVNVRDLFVCEEESNQLQGLLVYNGKSYIINCYDDLSKFVGLVKP